MIDSSTIAAMDAKLAELTHAYQSIQLGSIGMMQDLAYGGRLASAGATVREGLALMGGDLYQAVLGNHVFPLDDGTQADPDAALSAWNQLAQSSQEVMTGVLGYINKWGPLPSQGLLSLLKPLANPLEWPWYVQAAAGAAILFYGLQGLGMVGNVRRALGRRRRR